MKKGYVLKVDSMYLQYVTTNSRNAKNSFIESIYLTCDSDRCTIYDKENADELIKILYIVLGVKFELKEMEVDEDED